MFTNRRRVKHKEYHYDFLNQGKSFTVYTFGKKDEVDDEDKHFRLNYDESDKKILKNLFGNEEYYSLARAITKASDVPFKHVHVDDIIFSHGPSEIDPSDTAVKWRLWIKMDPEKAVKGMRGQTWSCIERGFIEVEYDYNEGKFTDRRGIISAGIWELCGVGPGMVPVRF